jgi:hypothetical protein
MLSSLYRIEELRVRWKFNQNLTRGNRSYVHKSLAILPKVPVRSTLRTHARNCISLYLCVYKTGSNGKRTSPCHLDAMPQKFRRFLIILLICPASLDHLLFFWSIDIVEDPNLSTAVETSNSLEHLSSTTRGTALYCRTVVDGTCTSTSCRILVGRARSLSHFCLKHLHPGIPIVTALDLSIHLN